jgi:DNA-binding transcriptional LysR family regulator
MPLLDRFDELERFGIGARTGKARVLTIGGSHTPSAFLLPSLVSIFKETHPKVQVVLRCASSRDIESMVLNSEVELAFVTAPSRLPNLIYKICRADELAVFASVRYPLADRRCLDLEKLAAIPLVVKRERSCQEAFLKCFRERGLFPNIAVECELPQMVLAAVKARAGLGILIRDAVEAELKEGGLRIIKIKDFSVAANTHVVHKKGSVLSSNAIDFLRIVNKRMRDLPMRTAPLEAA